MMRRTKRKLQHSRLLTYAQVLLVYLVWSGAWWNESSPTLCDSKVGHSHSNGFACGLPVTVEKTEREESSTSTSPGDGSSNNDRALEERDYEAKRTSLNRILVKAGMKGLGGGE